MNLYRVEFRAKHVGPDGAFRLPHTGVAVVLAHDPIVARHMVDLELAKVDLDAGEPGDMVVEPIACEPGLVLMRRGDCCG